MNPQMWCFCFFFHFKVIKNLQNCHLSTAEILSFNKSFSLFYFSDSSSVNNFQNCTARRTSLMNYSFCSLGTERGSEDEEGGS